MSGVTLRPKVAPFWYLYMGALCEMQSAFLMYRQEVVASRRTTIVSTRGVTMMGKFCSNCGAEVSGKFCSECGQAIGDTHNTHRAILNGVSFDAVRIFASHGGAKGRLDITRDVVQATGASLSDATAFVGEKLKDGAFMQAVDEFRRNSSIVCPSCKSQNIEMRKKGFGFGKGLVGALLLGPIGALAGGMGYNNVDCVCRNCGNRFTPKQ